MPVTVDVKLKSESEQALEIEAVVHRVLDSMPGEWAVEIAPVAGTDGGVVWVVWVVNVAAERQTTVTALSPGEQDLATLESRLAEVVSRQISER
jgi:hypothetical protein